MSSVAFIIGSQAVITLMLHLSSLMQCLLGSFCVCVMYMQLPSLVCGDQRLMKCLPHHTPPYSLKHHLSLILVLPIVSVAQQPSSLIPLTHFVGLTDLCDSSFHASPADLIPGPCVCISSTLPTEPSLQPLRSFLIAECLKTSSFAKLSV